MAAPNSTCCANAWCMRPEPGARTHQKCPRAFDLHNNAAIRCTSGRGPTSAARVVFDAQEHPLLGKIKVPEVV